LSAALEFDNVSVSYRSVEAVRHVSLKLPKGRIVAVIGPNGAGKTTLLNAAMGLLPASGRILFDGADISRLEVEERVERGLTLAPEKRELFADLSVIDNLKLGAYARRDAEIDSDLIAILGRFPKLGERLKQRASTLSGGERQMLTLARALMRRPTVLMLDEPSLGLAPLIVREIFRAISALRATGVSILLVEQNARAALETADYGYVLETGEISAEGEAKTLIDDPRLIATYLGQGE
jgi:branched-chain amino acid transport system ATP-binding protein